MNRKNIIIKCSSNTCERIGGLTPFCSPCIHFSYKEVILRRKNENMY